MNKVFLNDKFIDHEQAAISPMDRGFLFGDGIYEVIPTHGSRPVGLTLHLARMNRGLQEIGIHYSAKEDEWREKIKAIVAQFQSDSIAVYIHVSRGADTKRFHAYPQGIKPTVFAYGFEIKPAQALDRDKARRLRVVSVQDLRWQRCHIKSTSLLGNVMHFQQGQDSQTDEVILYDDKGIVSEAATCNVFMAKDGVISTPALDHRLLAGITREISLKSFEKAGGFEVQERDISLSELKQADEVWLSSSTRELDAVVEIDGQTVGKGKPGEMWLAAQTVFNRYKFDL